MKIEILASIVHAANRAYCFAINQQNQSPWKDTPKVIQNSVIQGVKSLAINPDTTPEQLHQKWVDYKRAEGWRYGTQKDIGLRIHPNIVPYNELSEEERAKDALFHAIVKAFLDELEWDEPGGTTKTEHHANGGVVIPTGVNGPGTAAV